jgi:glycine reductase complex component B subunit gamma
MTPIAIMVGSNRVIPGSAITQPLGNADLGISEEKVFRKTILFKALKALQTNLEEPRLF